MTIQEDFENCSQYLWQRHWTTNVWKVIKSVAQNCSILHEILCMCLKVVKFCISLKISEKFSKLSNLSSKLCQNWTIFFKQDSFLFKLSNCYFKLNKYWNTETIFLKLSKFYLKTEQFYFKLNNFISKLSNINFYKSKFCGNAQIL